LTGSDKARERDLKWRAQLVRVVVAVGMAGAHNPLLVAVVEINPPAADRFAGDA